MRSDYKSIKSKVILRYDNRVEKEFPNGENLEIDSRYLIDSITAENDTVVFNLKEKEIERKKTENQQTISIVDLLKLFGKHIVMLIILFIIGASSAFAYTKYSMDPVYSSHLSMYVQTYTDFTTGVDSEFNIIERSKELINTYIQVLKDDAVMMDLGQRLIEKSDMAVLKDNFKFKSDQIVPSSLLSCISINTISDTSAINISATTKNPELSALICNELSQIADTYTDKAIGVGEIKCIDTARIYETPVGPSKVKNTALGGIGLTALAMFIIFLIDFFDETIKNPDKLIDVYNKPIIGKIDGFVSAKHKRKTTEHISLLSDNLPESAVESSKAMRTNVNYALSTYDKKTIVVSSANPSEGKSTTAANLAITIADEGKRVVLIDGDMRKPVQHNVFTLKNDKGLSTFLAKKDKLEECIQQAAIPTLKVITSGPLPPNPSELMNSPQMEKLIETLSENNDVIIIDSPPVNVVSDSLNLSPHVAGLLAVVRKKSTLFSDIDELFKKAKLANMNIAGFVVTRANE
ncbi:MAG: polysaccharide biosynthesis tyrosine autokinase [Ruminococcus sp.]|nr:polysaccharide biosynthesis tyrosine autokinase [Ruminococcus sp.]